MSGECDKCGEHTLECKCYPEMNDHQYEALKREIRRNVSWPYRISFEWGFIKEWYYEKNLQFYRWWHNGNG